MTTVIGRVLDSGALVDFATQRTRYMEAVVWMHDQHVGSLVVPAPALAAATAQLPGRALSVLNVLLGLEVTVIVPLTREKAAALAVTLRAAGVSAAEAVTAASVVHEARVRRVPIVTDRPFPIRALHPEAEIDPLP
ncbi:hypothetical protein [Streptosporangium sp. NPDC051022]|uniref:hypothetical protein n=1 Tax=Streptosporangium sp. NPDC051022 TaxID=3155752 RepID=UPI00341BBE9E